MTKPLLALLLLVASSASVTAGLPTPAAFDQFVRETGPACVRAASRACFDRVFRFGDADRDGALDLAEVTALRDRSRDWLLNHSDVLMPADKQAAVMTLLAIDFVGVERLFQSYDVDSDGLVTRQELAADITLDERPIPVLAKDPYAVNWDQLLSRLGPGAVMLRGVLPSTGKTF